MGRVGRSVARMDGRVRAVSEMFLAEARENAGLHDYDGVVQDLSPDGVRGGLARLGGARLSDPVIDAHLAAFEDRARIVYHELEQHRSSPLLHLGNLDLAGYDRQYAPFEVRQAARDRHLQGWPDAVDAALESLVAVPRDVAQGLLGAVQGLVAGLDGDHDETTLVAVEAHRRLVARVQDFAENGEPDAAIGGPALARLMGAPEAMAVDLGRLAVQADAEKQRQSALLAEACGRIEPGRPVGEVVAVLQTDHPDAAGIVTEASRLVDEVIAFTREHGLAPDVDGECRVGLSPPSRRWATAMMSPSAPYEDDAASWYYITPPEASWPWPEQQEWLSMFSATALPAITVHEVAPGHFAHFRSLRRTNGEVRRVLLSNAFIEGWAHYAEELCLEEGFRAGDPRFAAGVALEALVRTTRLAVAIGLHTRSMSMEEAVHRFEQDAFLAGPAARSEAARATFDPGYGCYTWGKLEIRTLRDQAQAQWGLRYSHRRFHQALLDQGAPPLGIMGTTLD
jgi:hypothetical protein